MQPKFVAAENVVKTETQQTSAIGLLVVLLLGIYTPLEARVYCSQYQAERSIDSNSICTAHYHTSGFLQLFLHSDQPLLRVK